ncbi:MAG: hypothetical protein ACRDHL_14165 [Candidatus Promineifilaceae bacterium]
MNLIVEIETLLVEGLGSLDGQALRAAVAQELARLLQAEGLATPWANPAGDDLHLSARPAAIGLPPGPPRAAPLGAQVARAIYGGITDAGQGTKGDGHGS